LSRYAKLPHCKLQGVKRSRYTKLPHCKLQDVQRSRYTKLPQGKLQNSPAIPLYQTASL